MSRQVPTISPDAVQIAVLRHASDGEQWRLCIWCDTQSLFPKSEIVTMSLLVVDLTYRRGGAYGLRGSSGG